MLRRSPLKRSSKPMKRSKLRRKSTSPIRKIQDELWQECRRIVREQFGNDCYTCGKKNLQGSDCQLGHMIAKASLGAFLKYDIRLLRFQCYRCNINLGGQGAIFYRKMMAEQGPTYMEQLLQDKNKTVKASDYYPQLLLEYKSLHI